MRTKCIHSAGIPMSVAEVSRKQHCRVVDVGRLPRASLAPAMFSTDLETFSQRGSSLQMQVHLTQYLARHPSDW
jgi:hypothetical protein